MSSILGAFLLLAAGGLLTAVLEMVVGHYRWKRRRGGFIR